MLGEVVLAEKGRVEKGLKDRIHVAGVADVVQAGEACQRDTPGKGV